MEEKALEFCEREEDVFSIFLSLFMSVTVGLVEFIYIPSISRSLLFFSSFLLISIWAFQNFSLESGNKIFNLIEGISLWLVIYFLLGEMGAQSTALIIVLLFITTRKR